MTKPRIQKGGNKFQSIKAECRDAEAAGVHLIDLSIGQPTIPPPISACQKAAELILGRELAMNEYADNSCPTEPNFAERFVQAHCGIDFPDRVSYLPIPGIKPTIHMILRAALEGAKAEKKLPLWVYTTTPGYPTPADWAGYMSSNDLRHRMLTLDSDFRFDTSSIPRRNEKLIMMNYPHNPSGQISTRQWLEDLCAWCEKEGALLFNDAAYAGLAHTSEHCLLAEVACRYPDLFWIEALSASKLISTSWRVGALVGSTGFITDVATIKANTDSGFNPPLALGALHALEQDPGSIEAIQKVYAKRNNTLIEIGEAEGMDLTVMPKAGFFSLWRCPRHAFGQEISSAEEFNQLMIRHTGVVGVPFHPFIRYSVTSDIDTMADDIRRAFAKARIN